MRFRKFLLHEYTIVYLAALFTIVALGYWMALDFNIAASVDPHSYWETAHLHFDQSPVQKYRLLIPMLAAGLHKLIIGVGHHVFHIWPTADTDDKLFRISFFAWNALFTAGWLLALYIFCRSYKLSRVAAVIGLLVAISAKYSILNAGIPLVDAVYCMGVALTLVAIKKENYRLLFWCVLLMPLVKEAFLFTVPVLFFSKAPKLKLVLWLAMSGVLVFSYRYGFDHVFPHPMKESLAVDWSHFDDIPIHWTWLGNMDYWNDILENIGLWVPVCLVLLLVSKSYRKAVGARMEPYLIVMLIMMPVQAIVSGDFARMVLIGAMPIFVLWGATAAEQLQSKIIWQPEV